MVDAPARSGHNLQVLMCHGAAMSMPERLRRAVTARFGPLSRSAEQQYGVRETMIAALEQRGFRARGKTDEQIVQMLKRGNREAP